MNDLERLETLQRRPFELAWYHSFFSDAHDTVTSGFDANAEIDNKTMPIKKDNKDE